MNGLQSLMPGAPRQPQPQQAPAMPNDPRMGAAMSVVDDSVEKFNLDPQTEALMLQNQALGLLQAADNVSKMNAPQQDTNIQEQTTQGIAGMLQSLAPGMQQRGRQVQQAQARKMIGGGMPAGPAPARPAPARPAPARPPMGGMPSMGAPNMARMANGGIVGYNEGGFMGKVREIDTKLNAATDAAQNERMARGRRMSDYNVLADPYNSAVNIMYDTGIAGALQKLTGYESQLDKPKEKDPMAEQLRQFIKLQDLYEARKAAGAGEEELRRIESDLRSYDVVNAPGYNIQAEASKARGTGMARGGIIGYAGPDGSKVELDEDVIAAMLAQNAQTTAPVYPSAEERRVGLADEAAQRAQARDARRQEQLTRQELANRGLTGTQINQYLSRLDAVEPGGIGELKKPQFDTRNPQTGPFLKPLIDDSRIGTAIGGMADAVETTETPVVTPVTAPAAPQEFTPDVLDLLAEKELAAALNANPNTAATTRGDRLRELTGLDDLMARRIESEKAVRAQKESRLSPEQTRKRRLQAGLARLAEQGLGGFGAGRTAEMDKIAAERLGIEETSLADLNSLIAEKRAMGMTQFEAENSARAEIQASKDNAATAAGRRGDTRRAAFATSQENARNRAATAGQNQLNRESNERVAALQVAGSNETDLVRRLNIRMKEIKAANPELSETEIASRAMDMVEQQETSAALARVGIQASQQDFARYQGAAKIVIDRLANDLRTSTLSAADQQAAYETALEKEMENIARVLGDTPSTRNPNTPPLTSFDGS